MTDAIYDTPIPLDVKVGIKIRGLTIDFPSNTILVDYYEVDADGGTVQRHIVNVRIPGESAVETLRAFLSSVIKEDTASIAKTKRRILRYMLDSGLIAAATIPGEVVPPPVEP